MHIEQEARERNGQVQSRWRLHGGQWSNWAGVDETVAVSGVGKAILRVHESEEQGESGVTPRPVPRSEDARVVWAGGDGWMMRGCRSMSRQQRAGRESRASTVREAELTKVKDMRKDE